MITLAFEDKLFDLPQSWAEIKLGDYERWFQFEPQNRLDQIHYVAGLCRLDVEQLLDSPAHVFAAVWERVQFLFEELKAEPASGISVEGQDFVVSSTDGLTLAEWVDMEAVLEAGNDSRLSDLLAIVCRPVGEVYNSKMGDERKAMFRDLPMDRIQPLLAFFLLQNMRLRSVLSLYSEVRERASLYLELTRSSVVNGVGTRWLPTWRRIRFCALTKSLENQLSKSSDFCSTASTRGMRKRSRVAFWLR